MLQEERDAGRRSVSAIADGVAGPRHVDEHLFDRIELLGRGVEGGSMRSGRARTPIVSCWVAGLSS